MLRYCLKCLYVLILLTIKLTYSFFANMYRDRIFLIYTCFTFIDWLPSLFYLFRRSMQGSQSITFIAGTGRRRFPVINQSVVFAWYFLLQRKNVNMASSKRPQRRENHFIYDLPYSITRQICCNLDVDRGWEKLGLYKRQSLDS